MKKISPILPYIILWFIVNLFFLDNFPFMHADEPWLSGLSRQIAYEKQGSATEPFYDLLERHPHGLKILFQRAQIVFIELFGYSLFSVRLLSLCGGGVSLYLFYLLLTKLIPSQNKKNNYLPLFTTIALSLDIQFIYASHFARQEILMTALMLGALIPLASIDHNNSSFSKKAALSGSLIGLSLGFHPNAFLIAWPPALLLLFLIFKRKATLKEGGSFLAAAALTGSVFILTSLNYNPSFFYDYFQSGISLGVADTFFEKMTRFPLFLNSIYMKQGGTYYLPPLKGQLILLPIFVFFSLKEHKNRIINKLIITGLGGISIGLVLLGKFSPPSFLFYIPFFYLAGAGALIYVRNKWDRDTKLTLYILLILLLMGGTIINSFTEIRRETSPLKESYSDYLVQISNYLPPDSIVLGGLNLEYYLKRGNLYHWRNLPLLSEENNSFSDYIYARDINYIVVPEEIPFIYENSPSWDILYGRTDRWYPQMMEFLDESCEIVGEFSSPGYGNRVVAYRFQRDWPITIYSLIEKDSTRE